MMLNCGFVCMNVVIGHGHPALPSIYKGPVGMQGHRWASAERKD